MSDSKPKRSPTPQDLAHVLNTIVARVLDSVEPTEWDENHISFLLVRAIRFALSSTMEVASEDKRRRAHVRAEVYKSTGALEYSHGDIVIALAYVDLGLVGLGFYEAKAADSDGRFPAFNMRQLRRLTTSTPRLSLLLYDRRSRWICDDDYAAPLVHPVYGIESQSWGSTRVSAIGANVASRRSKLHSLPYLEQSFGHHFVTRYLSGRDLDYSRAPRKALEHWLKATKREAPVVVGVALSAREPVEPQIALPGYTPIPTERQFAEAGRPLLPP